jgi:D-methionine transport system permease protein
MLLEQLAKATFETVYMISCSGALASAIGIPLGFSLYIYSPKMLAKKSYLYIFLSTLVNAMRSIPFIIFLVALIPLTRILVGTSIGTTAALVPLTLSAVPFLARLVEGVLQEIPTGLIEAGHAMGATQVQLVRQILWPEALGGIVNAITVTVVNLVAYSAMAGAIGGGGLGDLAIRYGYQRFDVTVMISTIVILIGLVQGIQIMGDRLVKYCRPGQ